jgi:hypothetical protein
MTFQTLTLGKRKFVVVPESEFLRLQKRAAGNQVRADFGDDAMNELRAYRKTGNAKNWTNVKRKLGL